MKITAALLGIVIWVACTQLGLAQPVEPALKVGILDIDKVLHESMVGLFIQDQIEKKRTEIQKEFEGYEEELRKEEKELKDLQAKEGTHTEKVQEKQAAFEVKVDRVQREFHAKSKDLEESFSTARAEAIQAIMKLVSEIADEQKITLVIPKNIVMFRDEAFEFTEELMKRLNQRLPTVEIKMPKKA